MAHFSRLSQIVIDVPEAEHDATVGFWREALGLPLKQQQKYPEYHSARVEPHLGLLVQRLGDGVPKVHLDLHTTDRAAEVARLLALGATMVDDGEDWAIMRDPAGLIFCVVPDARLDETNAHAWPD
jgi:catechol 2,3-dioxygenase-like lactoylglutathione lyase family enzyme